MANDGRIRSLDALRGLAALLVLLIHAAEFRHHLSIPESQPIWAETFQFLKIGRVGVAIFFLLSGYLIARSLQADDWKQSFPRKRIFRLYPLFLASLLLALAFSSQVTSVTQFLANLTMLPSLFGQSEYIPLYWTLQTEVLFYLLIYSLKTVFPERLANIAWIGSIVLACTSLLLLTVVPAETLSQTSLLLKRLPLHLSLMLIGAQLGIAKNKTVPPLRIALPASLALAPALYEFARSAIEGFASPPLTSAAYLYAAVLFSLFLYAPIRLPVLERVGTVSYSMYLLHAFVIEALTPRLLPLDPALSLALICLATYLVAEISYRTIEKPGMSLASGYRGHSKS